MYNRVVSGKIVQCLSLLYLSLAIPSFAQYGGTNGIFAEFYTSMGNYTCRLDFVLAPKTVANFIGLATGERAWLDETTGSVKTTPLHAGTIFHRVVSNFVNQAGAPGGSPSGGPGYDFVDEFSPTLRHDSFGVLSMANTGPDSNGSQYFITVAPRPDLDDKYSVFGRLYGGSNVVYAINRVATAANERPLTDVTINSIAIRRIGPTATAFNIHTNGLPIVTNLNAKIARAAGNISLTFSNRLNTETRVYASTNLANWTGTSLGFEALTLATNALYRSANGKKEFFRMVQIQFPPALNVPRNVFNKTLTLNFSGGGGTFVTAFNNSGGGNYTWTGGTTGTVLYNWFQDAYRGRLRPIWFENSGYIMELHLDYDTGTAGTFKGTAYLDFFYPSLLGSLAVSGTFTSSP